jgi:hypothetical protein
VKHIRHTPILLVFTRTSVCGLSGATSWESNRETPEKWRQEGAMLVEKAFYLA